ncbi:MAG: cobalamin B12-binding domain-containing protein [Candidatus Tectomicrobia bacterium]|uniref:Cobalamin B12-binding domain-containing protein n=1 Tax=Tectimicrobiota bacterium TaxID=2528274 RepID=A0A933GLK0_UNCTE|nr:cobalamin B12-binding domain-containing protein [Candidatus Tectomicrobia bacterium]
MYDHLITTMADLEEGRVVELVQKLLDSNEEPQNILEACQQGMSIVGQRFEAGEYYLSDLIMAGEIFKQVSNLLTPRLAGKTNYETKGRIVIGTVKGDIHNIGKDIVVSMLRGANYEVYDLGVDVAPEKFVKAVEEKDASILGLSGLLTISFGSMRETVAALAESGLSAKVKVMIGGGPVTEDVRKLVGADALGRNAQEAVRLCNNWIA